MRQRPLPPKTRYTYRTTGPHEKANPEQSGGAKRQGHTVWPAALPKTVAPQQKERALFSFDRGESRVSARPIRRARNTRRSLRLLLPVILSLAGPRRVGPAAAAGTPTPATLR